MAAESGKHNLHWAISTGQLQQVKYFLSERNGPAQLSPNGINPLAAALQIDDGTRRKRVFNFLLQRGADVTKKDDVTGRDVFSWACLLGREEQVRKLLRCAPGEFSLRQTDKSGMAPIHYAVRGANPFVVYQLVREMKKFGVSIDVPNSQDGLTPLLMAKRLGYELISEILLTEGKACPSQFDTKTFRTKTRWSEIGSDERNKADLQTMIADLRINGSTRPHTSYQIRRDQALERASPEPKRLRPDTTGVQTRSSTKVGVAGAHSTYRPNYSLPPQELHKELQLSQLKQIVDGRASLVDIKKLHESEGDSGIQSSSTSGNISRYSKGSNTPNEKHVSWTKLNNLLSLSDRASVLSTERFARSVSVSGPSNTRPDPDAGNPQDSYNPDMIHSMMTAVSNQMSTSFRKPAVPRPKPEPKPAPKKRKKGSTLAFILSSQPGQKSGRRGSRIYNTRSTARARQQRSAQVSDTQSQSYRPARASRGYTFGHRSTIRNPSVSQLPTIKISS